MTNRTGTLRHLAGLTAAATAAVAVLREAVQASKTTSIAGKTVVITGGSRGLGLAMAEEFGRAGARLVLAARDEQELEQAREKLVVTGAVMSASDVLPVVCDLSKPGFARILIEGAIEHYGAVDILVNNAAVIYVGPAEMQPMESYRNAVETTYFSAVEACLAVLPHMLERGSGSIVNITSIGGKIPVPHLAPYVGSKFALVGFSETLHAEVRQRGVRVTTVVPGLMRTGSFPNAVITGNKEEEYEWFRGSSVTPGLSHSANAAARKIVRATAQGKTEISIGLETAFAAKLHGLAPTFSQAGASWMQAAALPKPADGGEPEEGRALDMPASNITASLAAEAIAANNQTGN